MRHTIAQSGDGKKLEVLGLCNNANGGGVALCIFFSELNKWPRLLSLGYNKKEEEYYVYRGFYPFRVKRSVLFR